MRAMFFTGMATEIRQLNAALLASAALALIGAAGPARADDCGPMGANNAVTCPGPSYDGIDYPDGGTVTLENTSMVVNGDIVIGSTSGTAGDAVLYGQQFLTVNGHITTTTTDGSSVIDLHPNVANATVNGGLSATAGGSDVAQISLGSVKIYNGRVAATNNGSGDALVSLTGSAIVGALWATANGSGHAIITLDQNPTITVQHSSNLITAESKGQGRAGEVTAQVTMKSGILNISGQNYGLIAMTGNKQGLSDVAVDVIGGSINATAYYYPVYAMNLGAGNAVVTIGDDSGSGPAIVSSDAILGVVAAEADGGGAAKVIMKSGSVSARGSNDDTRGLLQAISSSSSTSIIEISGGTLVNAVDGGSYGAIADSKISARVTLSGGSITTHNSYKAGVAAKVADGGIASVTMTGGEIVSLGDYSQAISVITGIGSGSVMISGGSISVTGDEAVAVLIDSPKASLSMSGGLISSSSADGMAIQVSANDGQATLDLSGGSIVLSGNQFAAIGLAAQTAVNAPDTTVSATITLGRDFTVDASASQNRMAFWNGNGAADSVISLSNSGTVIGHAMMGGGGSDITLSGGSFTGNIYGDYDQLNGQPSDAPNQGNDTLTWVGGGFAGTFYGQGGDDSVTIGISDAGAFSAAAFDGGEGTDTFTFGSASLSGIDGTKIVNFEYMVLDRSAVTLSSTGGVALSLKEPVGAGSWGKVTVGNGSTLTIGPGSLPRVTTIQAGLTIETGGSLVIGPSNNVSFVGLIENRGGIVFSGQNTNNTLSSLGDYNGDGGSLTLSVDFSTSGRNDALAISGSVLGRTNVLINAVNTSSAPNVYNLVAVNPGRPIDPAAFQLTNGTVVSGGFLYALQYSPHEFVSGATRLVPGFILAPTTSTGHLEKFIDEDFVRRAGMRELVAAGVALQPYVPLYEAYPSVLLDMMAMPSFETRSGGRYGHGEGLAAGPALDAVWGRVEGAFSHNDPEDSTTSYDTDLSQMELQAGLDGLFLDSDAGVLIASLTGHYKDGEAKVGSPFGSSKIRPGGWGFGGTLTWLGAGGFYVDGQAELTWFTSEMKADSLPLAPEDGDAFGYGLSAQIGQRIALADGLSLTPQAQLAFTNVSIDGFAGAYGENVSFDDGQSLVGRLGLGLEKLSQWQDAAGKTRSARFYGTASVNHDFLGDTTAILDNVYTLDASPDAWSGEIAFGGSYDFTTGKTRVGLYAELTAATGFDTGSYGYGGNIGLKVRW